jgi:high frequency lysogenization protein
MDDRMRDRALALAGLLQAVDQVQRMANQGQSETRPLAACINSLFLFDAESTEEIYGGLRELAPGLQRLVAQVDGGPGRDAAQTRIAMNVLHLERRFIGQASTVEKVRKALEDIGRQRDHLGPTHPTVLGRLGELYAEQISPLGPRIMIQGNPVYLAQPSVVAEVRATLLAAVRAAVLWRQLGGSYWDFLLSRRRLVDTAHELLEVGS